MVGELNILNEWIPEQMEPGTIFVLERVEDSSDNSDPYVAVLACPQCGTLGLVTRRQLSGAVSIICGSDTCPAHFILHESEILVRKPS